MPEDGLERGRSEKGSMVIAKEQPQNLLDYPCLLANIDGTTRSSLESAPASLQLGLCLRNTTNYS